MTPPGTQSPPHTQLHASVAAANGAAPVESSLDSQIDALLSDASGADAADNAEHSHTPPHSAAADAEAAVASIEKQVESLVEQFVEQAEPQVAATTQDSADQSDPLPAPASTADEPNLIAPDDASANAAPESIGELDDQLARLTDELLTAPAIEPYQAPSVKFAPTPEDQIEPAPVVMPQVAVAVAAAAISSPVAPTETPTPIAIPVVVATPARPSKLVQAFAKPLAGKPRLVRDTVGWLGFNSMFLAGVVWSYHLWFQKPEKPVAQHAPAALVSSDGHDDPAHGQAAATGHGAPAAGDAHAGHGAKPEDAHADASHGSDEPITGVRPLHKKKPTYALSDAMAERLNVAKKADAGGHGAEKKSGGGHGAPAKSGH